MHLPFLQSTQEGPLTSAGVRGDGGEEEGDRESPGRSRGLGTFCSCWDSLPLPPTFSTDPFFILASGLSPGQNVLE